MKKMRRKYILQGILLLLVVAVFIVFIIYAMDMQSQKQERLIQSSINREEQSLLAQNQSQSKYMIFINEIYHDEGADSWIELYNSSEFEVALDSYSLVHNSSDEEYVFPRDTKITARGFMIVRSASSEEDRRKGLIPIAFDGSDFIELRSSSGEVIDFVTIPQVDTKESYGRVVDGGIEFLFMSPTQTTKNGEANIHTKPYPVLTVPSGFYENEFELKIYAPEGYDIYFTLDGSEPTENSTLYEGPIKIADASLNDNELSTRQDISINKVSIPKDKIDKATVVKSILVDGSGNRSKVVTATYFVGYDRKQGYENIPVISIVTDQVNLFNYWDGLYVLGRAYDDSLLEALNEENANSESIEERDYANYWKNYIKDGFIQVFENGNLSYSGSIKLSTYNDDMLDLAQKSLLISNISLNKNGNTTLNEVIKSNVNNGTLLLSSGRNDFYTKLRNSLLNDMLQDRAVATQQSELCAVFLDGEYWGVYNITELYSSDSIGRRYGIEPANIAILSSKVVVNVEDGSFSLSNKVISAGVSDQESFLQLINFASANDLSTDAAYETIKSMMDIQSFIDCYAAMIYSGDSVWLDRDQYVWKARTTSGQPFEDGKWRWILTEADQSLGNDAISGYRINSFQRPVLKNDVLFNGLIKNETFKAQFVRTFMDLANENLGYGRVSTSVNEAYDRYDKAMAKQYERFLDYGDAKLFLDSLYKIKEFFNNRLSYMSVYLKEQFGLKGELVNVTVMNDSPEAGSVKINNNTAIHFSEGKWSGQYYTDYPVTLEATPAPGYRFDGWQDQNGKVVYDASNQEISVNLNTDGRVWKAVFVKN